MKQINPNTIQPINNTDIATEETINRPFRQRVTLHRLIDQLDTDATMKMDFANNSYHIRELPFNSVNKQFVDMVPFTRVGTRDYTSMTGVIRTATDNQPAINWLTNPRVSRGLFIADTGVDEPDELIFDNLGSVDWFNPRFGTFVIKVDTADAIVMDGLGVTIGVYGQGVLVLSYDNDGYQLKTFNNTITDTNIIQPLSETIAVLATEACHVESIHYVPRLYTEEERRLLAYGDLTVGVIDVTDAMDVAAELLLTENGLPTLGIYA